MKNPWVLLLTAAGLQVALTAELRIGVASSLITPFLEQPLAGYYYPRTADGVHDHLQAKALILDDGRRQVVLVACGIIGVRKDVVAEVRARVQKQLGIPPDHILASATHCHTGPQRDLGTARRLPTWASLSTA